MIPAPPGCARWWPGLLVDAAAEDPGLCKGPPTLGRRSPATDLRWASPTGGKCAGASVCYGSPDHIHQCGGSGRCPAASNWVKITSSRMAEPAPRECSHNRTHRDHARGSFSAAYGEGWPRATTAAQIASQQAIPAWEIMPEKEGTSSQCPTSQPGFAEIAPSLHGDKPPRVVTDIPPELAEDQDPSRWWGPPCSLPSCSGMRYPGPCVLTWWCVQWTC